MPQLDQILSSTRAGLPGLRARRAEVEREAGVRQPPPSFVGALRREKVAVIAEVKRRSPSAGAINPGLDPGRLSREYQAGGAAAISVLTEEAHFGGSLSDLRLVVEAVSCPVLRKDFIVDELQVVEARAAGAAAVLLIVRILTDPELRTLLRATAALGLDALVEAHDAAEVDRALAAGARIVGVNARDLDTFTIDRDAAWRLLARMPAGVIAVAESGMGSPADVAQAAEAGADAVLMGTALAGSGDPAGALRSIVEVPRRAR